MFLCYFSEQEKKESDDIDHDAIAHRLKQDVVCIILEYLFFSYNRLGTFHDSELFSDILLDKGIVLTAENFTLQL